MYCKKCGNQLKDGAKFCPKCGASLRTAESKNSNMPTPVEGQQKPVRHFPKVLFIAGVPIIIIGLILLMKVGLPYISGYHDNADQRAETEINNTETERKAESETELKTESDLESEIETETMIEADIDGVNQRMVSVEGIVISENELWFLQLEEPQSVYSLNSNGESQLLNDISRLYLASAKSSDAYDFKEYSGWKISVSGSITASDNKVYLIADDIKKLISPETSGETAETADDQVVNKESETVTEGNPESEEEAKRQEIVLVSDTGDTLNIRSEASHESDLVKTISEEYMYYLGENGDGLGSDGEMHTWYHISLDDSTTGWVRSDLVKLVSSKDLNVTLVSDVDGGLNVRSLPTHDSSLVETVYSDYLYADGQTDEGLGSDGEMHTWYHIQLDDGKDGWVRSDLVKIIVR